MSKWIEYKLSNVMEIIGGGTPKTSVEAYWGGNIPWLSVVDFNTGLKFVYTTEKSITEKGFNESSTKYLQKGDIIFSARGTVGAMAVLEAPMTFNQSCYGLRAKKNVCRNDFLYYLIKNSLAEFENHSYGAVFDTITKDSFSNITVNIPALAEQESIADVLGSLDDEIDLLHRNNKTLEQLAETIFRQWIESDVTLADSTIQQLRDIAEVQNGYSFRSSEFVSEGFKTIEVLKMGHISPNGGLKAAPKKDFVTRSTKYEKFILRKRDIVLAMTDMKDNVVILGVPALVDCDDKYVLNQRVARINLKKNSELCNILILYMQMRDSAFISDLQSKANSGVQVNLGTESIRGCKIIVPAKRHQEQMTEQLSCLFEKLELNRNQIEKLEKLRDILLPKLMSGEMIVVK